MSVCKHIACTDCKVHLRIGQGGVIYCTTKHLKSLSDFLFIHHKSSSPQGSNGKPHNLISTDEHEYVDGLLADYSEVLVEE